MERSHFYLRATDETPIEDQLAPYWTYHFFGEVHTCWKSQIRNLAYLLASLKEIPQSSNVIILFEGYGRTTFYGERVAISRLIADILNAMDYQVSKVPYRGRRLQASEAVFSFLARESAHPGEDTFQSLLPDKKLAGSGWDDRLANEQMIATAAMDEATVPSTSLWVGGMTRRNETMIETLRSTRFEFDHIFVFAGLAHLPVPGASALKDAPEVLSSSTKVVERFLLEEARENRRGLFVVPTNLMYE